MLVKKKAQTEVWAFFVENTYSTNFSISFSFGMVTFQS